MARLPILSGRETVSILTVNGFSIRPRKSGDHFILVKDHLVVAVPDHKELAKGTLLNIIRRSELSKETFTGT